MDLEYFLWTCPEMNATRPHWRLVNIGSGNGLVLSAINSLAPGKIECNFRHIIFKHILVIDGWGISCEISLIWMSLDFTDDQSTLVQVMAWCRQAPTHYLSQCWPRSLLPYGVTRPQWATVDPDQVTIWHHLAIRIDQIDMNSFIKHKYQFLFSFVLDLCYWWWCFRLF